MDSTHRCGVCRANAVEACTAPSPAVCPRNNYGDKVMVDKAEVRSGHDRRSDHAGHLVGHVATPAEVAHFQAQEVNALQERQMAQQAINRQVTAREKILEEARVIVTKDRNTSYGNPEDNFSNIAALWNSYLRARFPNISITSADVAVMSMLIKIARLATNPGHHDSCVDVAGYAACLGDIQEVIVKSKAQNSSSGSVLGSVGTAATAASLSGLSLNRNAT